MHAFDVRAENINRKIECEITCYRNAEGISSTENNNRYFSVRALQAPIPNPWLSFDLRSEGDERKDDELPFKYSQPGVGDPYWFEWYVGLGYVISMLAGSGDIESVTFQEAGLEGVDDVVVRRSHGLPMVCVQVKHIKASTTSANNLTFGALVAEGAPGEGRAPKRSLLTSLAAGWKQISLKEEAVPEIVLYTNREMGSKKTDAVYMGKPYKRLPLGEFWDKVSAGLGSVTSFSELFLPIRTSMPNGVSSLTQRNSRRPTSCLS